MSGVVLRCPNCGTTRSTPGMCEACHEAEVRYYCTNHTPGLWLNASTCSPEKPQAVHLNQLLHPRRVHAFGQLGDLV